jgi:hypothetical protein
MKNRTLFSLLFAICFLGANFSGAAAQPASAPGSTGIEPEFFRPPAVAEMSVETKREIRQELLQKLIQKYNRNNTFPDMSQYMADKYQELAKKGTAVPPEQLIAKTLDKSRSVFEKVKSFVGSNFKRQYNPVTLEASINKYLWLKGICFLILGIREEHKIAVSYFYRPGRESVKKNFMIDAVKYSFPEVRDIPENAEWFEAMGEVMERLGFKLFNVDKYVDLQKTGCD